MRRRNLHQSPSYIPSIRATAQTQRGHLESCGFVQGKRLGQYSELPESWDACRDDLRSDRWPAERPLTDEDIRIHAWLNDRLAELHYQRHGLWPRLRRLLIGRGSSRSRVLSL